MFQKQQISKNSRFQKIYLKKKTVKKQQISRNNRFQETTDFKKQQISKNNRYQKPISKTTDFKKNSRFEEINLKNNRFQQHHIFKYNIFQKQQIP